MSVRVTFAAIRANARIIPSAEVYAALHEYVGVYCGNLVLQMAYTDTDPPGSQREGHHYVRTFHMFNSWRVRDISTGAGVRYQINNPVQDKWGRYYSAYVHGPGQTDFHAAGGWWTMQEKIDRPEFRRGAQAVLQTTVGVR
jgi:hypothetical protein